MEVGPGAGMDAGMEEEVELERMEEARAALVAAGS